MCRAVATIEDLRDCIDDLSEDGYRRATAIVNELEASGDRALVPRLAQELRRYLDTGNFYGRDIIAQVLVGLAGVGALPLLIEAASWDLGDDQDSLHSAIIDAMWFDMDRARVLLGGLRVDASAEVLRMVDWAQEILESGLI
jgi:hypothetical protein